MIWLKLKTMQRLFFLLFLSVFAASAFAQNFTKTGESDPKAKAVLEKMRKKYEAYTSLEADFNIVIEEPEQKAVTQKGKLLQAGEKYRLTLNDRTMVSDGKSVWLHLPKTKEVQINDVEEDAEEGLNSPQDLLKAYEWKNYVYVLTNEFEEGGKVVQQIEFKPLDRSSEYSKIRLTVDKTSNDVVSIKSFGKDGSRYTLNVGKLTPNKSLPAATFTFAKSECADCHFEDLRLD